MASRQAFFSAVVSFASSRDAALACLASCVICSVKVMRREGKPKSQTGKCEVSCIFQRPRRFHLTNSPTHGRNRNFCLFVRVFVEVRLFGFVADFDFLAFIDKHIRLAHFTQFHAADQTGVERIRFWCFCSSARLVNETATMVTVRIIARMNFRFFIFSLVVGCG